MIWMLRYWKIVAIVIFCGLLVLYGYRWGAGNVEAEYDALRSLQRVNAAAASQSYQEYRKNSDMTKIRKELEREIRKGHSSCIVIDDKRLRLYKAAGIRNSTP